MSIVQQNNYEKAIKAFSQRLQCVICLKLPNLTKICPYCSVLFCSNCIIQWLSPDLSSDSEEDDVYRSNCPHCRKELRFNSLIRLTCFDNIANLGPALERPSHDSCSISNSPEDDTVSKPKYASGNFTLRNFIPRRGPFKIYSEKITDDLGSVWRLEVNPRGARQNENYWVGAFVQLVKGLEGKYEFIIETLNACPKRSVFEAKYEHRSSMGTDKFIDSRSLADDGNPIDLKFRFFIRPVSYEEKANLQNNLINKLKLQDKRYMGYAKKFDYYINNFSKFDKHCDESTHHYKKTDNIGNLWKLGLDTLDPGKLLKFKVRLCGGYIGLYEISLALVHDEAECTKKLTKQHLFGTRATAVINMQIRWNQLEEFGYTHFDDDFLKIEVNIYPVHISLSELQGYGAVELNCEDEEYLC